MINRNATERNDDRGSYRHEPFVNVTRETTNQNLTANVYNRIELNSVYTNELGAWVVSPGYYECLKSGRLDVRISCVFFTGTSGSDAVQLVTTVTNASNVVLVRFVNNQFGLVPNNTFYTLNGSSKFAVEYGFRVYHELFVQSTGAYILPNVAGIIYNYASFCYLL